MTLAGVYSFWKYVSKLERRETRRYLEMFYILKFRDLVSDITSVHLLVLEPGWDAIMQDYELYQLCPMLYKFIA